MTNKCKHFRADGICTYYSDVEVTQPCIEGPCEHDTTRTASPRFTSSEIQAIETVLKMAEQSENVPFKEIHLSRVRFMLQEEK